MRLGLVLALAAFAVALLPAAASAAAFCVHSYPGCADTHASVQAAFDAADSEFDNPGPDRVQIGPGEHPGGRATTQVDVVGVTGGSPTVLTTRDPNEVLHSYSLRTDSPFSTVSDLSIKTGNGKIGLTLIGTAERVTIFPASATDSNALSLDLRGTFRDGQVTGSTGSGSVAVWASFAGQAFLEDSIVTGRRGVEMATGTGPTEEQLTVRRSRITASADVAALQGYVRLRFEDCLLRLSSSGGNALDVYSGVNGNSSLEARHVTLIGPGTGGNTTALRAHAEGGRIARIDVDDSIIRGFDRTRAASAGPGGMSSADSEISVDYSNFDPSADTAVDDTEFDLEVKARNTGANNVNVDPEFVDPGADDFRIPFDSPMVDAATPGTLAAGESSTDLDGDPRIRDGDGDGTARRDMGTFEYQRTPPTPAVDATPDPAAVGQAIMFSGSASDPDPDETPSYSWSFDDGGSASGQTVQHAFSSPGTHTATLTVTDPTGLQASASRQVTVIGGGTGDDGNVLPKPSDLLAPVVSQARVRNKTFRVGPEPTALTAQRRRRARVGTAFMFSLSETARVTIAIAQQTRGRRVGRRCVKQRRSNRRRRACKLFVRRGALTRNGLAGPNTVAFSGRLGRRALRPGRYRATITGTDAAGNRSAPRTVSFSVVRR